MHADLYRSRLHPPQPASPVSSWAPPQVWLPEVDKTGMGDVQLLDAEIPSVSACHVPAGATLLIMSRRGRQAAQTSGQTPHGSCWTLSQIGQPPLTPLVFCPCSWRSKEGTASPARTASTSPKPPPPPPGDLSTGVDRETAPGVEAAAPSKTSQQPVRKHALHPMRVVVHVAPTSQLSCESCACLAVVVSRTPVW